MEESGVAYARRADAGARRRRVMDAVDDVEY